MRLKRKKAIVTGAGQGIGRSIALKMAREGADVVIAEMNPDTGARTAKEVEALGEGSLSVSWTWPIQGRFKAWWDRF